MMRKFATMVVILIGMAISLKGQGSLVSATPSIIAAGYSGDLSFTGLGTNFSMATCGINLRLTHSVTGQVYSFGTAPTGPGWMPGSPWPTDTVAHGNVTIPSNATPGYYNVQLDGYEGYYCLSQVSNVFAPSMIYIGSAGLVQGQFVHDRDSNCARNGTDTGLSNQIITITPGPYYAITDANGNFRVPLIPGTYTLSSPAPTGSAFVCPAAPFTHTVTVATVTDTVTGVDFFVKGNHEIDLEVEVVASAHRPGFTTNAASIYLTNNGFNDANNVEIKLVKPSAFTFTSFSSTPTSVSGDTATWTIPILPANSHLIHSAYVTVPVGTPLSTPYQYQGFVTSTSLDVNGYNNFDDVNGVVVGSFDPNDKQVWTANGQNADGFINDVDSVLQYLIRFQNTGTDTAFNISIADVIDPDLNISTLKVEAASSNYLIDFQDSSGHDLKFVFPNILLPDSNTNEVASHGFIQYSIHRNPGLGQGTMISNRGDIYFDFNQPVLTNTVHSTICNSLGSTFDITVNGLQVDFEASMVGNPIQFEWDFGDGGTANTQSPTHTYASNGVYQVCLHVSNDCGREDTLCENVYVGVAGVKDLGANLQRMSLVPNPANDLVMLQIDAERLHGVQLTLRDLQGKAVEQWNVNAIFGKYVKQLPVGHLAPGLYFLNLQSLEAQYTVKLMVE